MRRISVLLVIVLLITFLFNGCAHEHEWKEASCFSPKTCIGCGETEGKVRGHNWIAATCNEEEYCSDCGKKGEAALGHLWTSGLVIGVPKCLNCGVLKPLPLPASGTVFIGSDLNRESEISINSSSDKSCYIKLKGSSGIDVFSFFVRAGESVTVSVPKGYYYVYFSYGTEWHGPELLFGEDTTYTKDDEIMDFESYTWTYTLYPTSNGNFSETPIDEEEFK